MLKVATLKWFERALWLAAVFAFALAPAAALAPVRAQEAALPPSGMVCTTSPGPNPVFTLTARTGYISLADGNTAFMWSFSNGDEPFQYPGPVLCVNEGDNVSVVVRNTLTVPISLVFPGQAGVLADGAPVQPDLANNSLTTSIPAGGVLTYSFTASRPGTFGYQSGTNPAIQVNMGLFGALVVRPALAGGVDTAGGTPIPFGYAYGLTSTVFNADTEYLLMLSEIDPYLHTAVERGQPFDLAQYKPRYNLINGRAFPDTLAPNGASWLPAQPYGALTHIRPLDPRTTILVSGVPTANPAYYPYPALQRYLNFGYEDVPFHPHGNSGIVIGRDGYVLNDAAQGDLSFEKFTVPVAPGQSWDVTFDWRDAESFDPVVNPIPVEVPNEASVQIGAWFGSPYLGQVDTPAIVGITSFNQCGEYYHIAHSHNLTQINGWNSLMVGLITFTRVDPPLPNNCPVN
ncbi:MAG: multicopper oxidase domain-containing protein [Anaerolineales bacterium]|nr:multicopper oxidase domain-containing protein [Anaerolineales bacterium]